MIRIGTRESHLAQAQANLVLETLQSHGHDAQTITMKALGDENETAPIHRLGIAGAFTSKLESALQEGTIDLAVHSLKDLPLDAPKGLTVAAILERGPPQDTLLIDPDHHDPQQEVPLQPGSRVATSGPRRQSQILAARPDLTVVNVRGNVDTRISKLRDAWFDALITARVALDRLRLDPDALATHDLDPDRFPPSPGQAAIAVQARQGSPAAYAVEALDHEATRKAVEVERDLLGHLGGGCGLPLGAWAREDDEAWRMSSTFAGKGWTPAHEPALIHKRVEADKPRDLVPEARTTLATVQPTPRNLHPAEVSLPKGPTLLILASRPTATAWAAHLAQAGHRAIPVPTSTFTHADPPKLKRRFELQSADWMLVTSRQAVAPLARVLLERPPDAYIAAVGPSTARALHRAGLPCHLVAPDATGESLAGEILRLADPGDRILLAQTNTPHGSVRDRLAQAEALTLDTWTAYRTHPVPLNVDDIDASLPAKAALVMSPRSATRLEDIEPDALALRFIAIGPSTSRGLTEQGIPHRTASAPTPQAILEEIT